MQPRLDMKPFLWLVLWLCLSKAQVHNPGRPNSLGISSFLPIQTAIANLSNSTKKCCVHLWLNWRTLWFEGFLPGHMPGQQESDCSQVSAQQFVCDYDDESIARRAREEGRVDVVFPGSVTQDGCCRFVCELLKCVLYQRQQLPMTYDQMVFFQKQQLTTSQVRKRVGMSKTQRLKDRISETVL